MANISYQTEKYIENRDKSLIKEIQSEVVSISGDQITGTFDSNDVGLWFVVKDEAFTILSVSSGVATLDDSPTQQGDYIAYWGEDIGPYITGLLVDAPARVNLPAGNYLMIEQVVISNPVEIIGDPIERTTLWKSTHILGINQGIIDDQIPITIPQASAFQATSVSGIEIRNLGLTNIGDPNGEVTDPNYYDTLNGVAVTYTRVGNKRVNRGMLFYGTTCTNVRIVNNAISKGQICSASGGSGWYIAHNTCSVWGEVPILPPSNSIIKNNTLIQDAYKTNQTDINSDLGTSHAIYVTSGFSNVTIENNYISGSRINGIQFNTVTGTSWTNELINKNKIINTYRAFFLGGGNAVTQGEFTIKNNTITNCGILGLIDCPSIDVVISDNTFDGTYFVAGEDQGNFGLSHAHSNSVQILRNLFKNREEKDQDSSIRFAPADGTGDMTIGENTFESTAGKSIFITDPVSTTTNFVLIEKNFFCSDIEIGDNTGADPKGFNCTIRYNRFDSTDFQQGVNINLSCYFWNNVVTVDDSKGAVVINNITGNELILELNTFNGTGAGVIATNSDGNYSFLSNKSNGPTWTQGVNPPNRDENNVGF